MSEYQYYEFRAIDRPLTDREMGALRRLSTRAEITSTSFTNVYNFGDFRGNPDVLMQKYFDAFVHVANWGTRELMFRLPKKSLNTKAAAPTSCGIASRPRRRGATWSWGWSRMRRLATGRRARGT